MKTITNALINCTLKETVKQYNLCTWFKCQLGILNLCGWAIIKFTSIILSTLSVLIEYWDERECVCLCIAGFFFDWNEHTRSCHITLVCLKKHWLWYMIWRGRGCLCPVFTGWIWGMWRMNLETLLVWNMIKRSLWRTYNFKGSTQTVGFQSISQSLISSPYHKWIWISLAVAYYLSSNCTPKWSAGIYSRRQKLHQMLLC